MVRVCGVLINEAKKADVETMLNTMVLSIGADRRIHAINQYEGLMRSSRRHRWPWAPGAEPRRW